MLITGGTVFVSRFAAEYFSETYDVYVLNRNTHPQSGRVTLIEGDRHALGNRLKGLYFDVVLDITAYDEADITDLLDGLDGFGDYVFVSSSAVYPETEQQPFTEEMEIGPNAIWGKYGTDKISAEKALLKRIPSAYILRPPYLYGPGNNVYREAFVFDCALNDRPFYLPGSGEMKLQFFHVEDLCRFIECLLREHPENNVFNVGNPNAITIQDWVRLCYQVLGKEPRYISVTEEIPQRSYFPFHDYAYFLDITRQSGLMDTVKPMEAGLLEAYEWYRLHETRVRKKPLLDFIDDKLIC